VFLGIFHEVAIRTGILGELEPKPEVLDELALSMSQHVECLKVVLSDGQLPEYLAGKDAGIVPLPVDQTVLGQSHFDATTVDVVTPRRSRIIGDILPDLKFYFDGQCRPRRHVGRKKKMTTEKKVKTMVKTKVKMRRKKRKRSRRRRRMVRRKRKKRWLRKRFMIKRGRGGNFESSKSSRMSDPIHKAEGSLEESLENVTSLNFFHLILGLNASLLCPFYSRTASKALEVQTLSSPEAEQRTHGT
jgi:hypothetical protein